MTVPEVILVDTGVANIASLVAAFGRLGLKARLSLDDRRVREAEALVLPGVGAFAAGMARLREAGLVEALRARVVEDRPTLAVCLGLQLLCSFSEESPGVDGLDVVPARVTRFQDSCRVPQFGWNRVTPGEGARLVLPGFAYFANSYRVAEPPPGFGVSTSEHGGPFVAALERGALLACQFHPELSGAWGQDLLLRWLQRGGVSC